MSQRSFVEEEIVREKRTSPGLEIPSLCDRIREAWRRRRIPSSAVDVANKINAALAANRMGLLGDYEDAEIVYPTLDDDPQW